MASRSIINTIVAELRQHAPFDELGDDSLRHFADSLTAVYFASGETVLAPTDAAPAHIFIVKSGRIVGQRQALSPDAIPAFELTAGDMFPIGAALSDRPIRSTFTAASDTFCYRMPVAEFRRNLERNPILQDFVEHHVQHLLERSRAAIRASYAAETLSGQALTQPLATMLAREPVTCTADTSVEVALRLMHDNRVGSVVLVDGQNKPTGILTERDVIGRIVLPQLPLRTPVAQVASTPVIALDEQESLSAAALAMVEQGIRHIAITRAEKLVGVISERSLFTLQRQTVAGLGDALNHAPDTRSLIQCAADIRALSRSLAVQGVSAGLLTEIISRLNDQLTRRLIQIEADAHRLNQIQGLRWCWLAFGSEGRQEQTISTDQDNGLIFSLGGPAADEEVRTLLLLFALKVNQQLAMCGFPLCKGNIMASNSDLTLTTDAWRARFERWIDAGDPKSLLKASIFFDFRGIGGDLALATQLSEAILPVAQRNTRFLKQLAENCLQIRPPLDWLGRIEGGSNAQLDLKMHGAMPFTDAARLLALSCGVSATRSTTRLDAAGKMLGIPESEIRAWSQAFEFVQMLRLRHQHDRLRSIEAGRTVQENPNLIEIVTLSELDRRILREVFRQARKLQQRIALDYAL